MGRNEMILLSPDEKLLCAIFGMKMEEISPVKNEIDGVSLRDSVESQFSCLTERQGQVIKMRFGFIDGKSKTLEEVAHHLGLTNSSSRERVRRIEQKALRKLRHPRISRVLKEYIARGDNR